MLRFRPRRWNSAVYGNPRASSAWLTLATIGDSATSKTRSNRAGVDESHGCAWLSHGAGKAPGVAGSPSPECQTPNLPSPAAVWKPQLPPVLNSHNGLTLMPLGVLSGCRNGNQPPLLLSKFHGARWPASAGLFEFRIPLSRIGFPTPSTFGRMLRSGGFREPLRLRSSPSSLVKCPAGAPVPLNRDENVTSSDGSM